MSRFGSAGIRWLTLVVALGAAALVGVPGAGAAPPNAAPATVVTAPLQPAGAPDLGPNVTVFDPSMPTADIQAAVDAIRDKQVDNEMGTDRYALLFRPGVYGSVAEPLMIQVGYYTDVAGLGASPGDVTINGHVDVYNRCLLYTSPSPRDS